ncbi:MAG: DEAD/DEAH box helicase [Deltaproteobacteria bacterium]|nr:DEAD/DEAH box helicase [Deltaproteobacteria bacterium]
MSPEHPEGGGGPLAVGFYGGIAAEAMKLGVRRLLEEPLLAFSLESDLVGPAARVLENALRRWPDARIADLASAGTPGAPTALSECAQAKPRFAIAQALSRFLQRHATNGDGLAARVSVESPPRDGLEAWVEQRGLKAALLESAEKAIGRWLSYRATNSLDASVTVGALLSATLPGRLAALPPEEIDRLRSLARTWLHARALQSVSPPRRAHEVSGLPLPADPVLAALVQRIEQTLGRLKVPQRRAGTDEFQLTIDLKSIEFLWQRRSRQWNYVTLRTCVPLESWREEPVRALCGCAEPKPCDHEYEALDAVRHFLCTPADPALAQRVATLVARPGWGRRLDLLDQALSSLPDAAKAQPVDSLVSWRLKASGYGPTLTPYVHHPLKRGGYSKGTRTDIASLRNDENLSFPNASQVLALLSGPAAGGETDRVFEALVLLSDYPHLYAEGQSERALQVRRGSFELSAEELPDGKLRLVPTVDGNERWGKEACVSQRRRHVLVDPEAAVCCLLELTSAQHRLASALRQMEALGQTFPRDALGDLMPRLAAVERHLPLRLPPSLEGAAVEPDRRLVLRLTPKPDGSLDLVALVRPLSSGLAVEPGSPPTRLTGFVDGKRVHVDRDLQQEREHVVTRLSQLPLPAPTPGTPFGFTLQGDLALDVLASLERSSADDLVVEWPRNSARVTVAGRVEPSALKLRIENKHDWFGIAGEAQLDEDRIALAVLLEAVRRGSRYAQIGPGRFVEIAAELRTRLERAADVVFSGRSGLEVSPAGAEALDDLLDAAGEQALCSQWRDLVQRMRSAQSLEPRLPKGFEADLRPYQSDGFRWLMRMAQWGVGACLADDMGLGKTVQTLAVLQARAALGPALVIAPTSVSFNWLRECQRFTPGLRPVLFHEADRDRELASLSKGDVLISSYGLVLRHAEQLKAQRFATLVVDEAQAIKNPATRRARAVRDLSSDWRVALTGTPIENHLGELWSLFRVLTPGLLGSWDQFRERFAGPIERAKDDKRRAALARVVRPFILRRTKDKVAPELPARTELKRLIVLTPAERQLYDDARLAAVAYLSDAVEAEGDKRFEALAAITRLRQLACHPRLLDPASKVPSSKLKELLALVDELRENGHKALIFSQFTSHLALVREALDGAGVRYQYLDGSTPEADRRKRVDAFQAGESDLFLISLKAGGTGLNLTAADFVIHLDPWWNPAVEDQATGRAHRIGQNKPVTVYRLVAQGTIEEAILALHDEKRDLVAGVLDGAGTAGKLSTEELLALIRGGESAPEAEEDDDEGDLAEPLDPAPLDASTAGPDESGPEEAPPESAAPVVEVQTPEPAATRQEVAEGRSRTREEAPPTTVVEGATDTELNGFLARIENQLTPFLKKRLAPSSASLYRSSLRGLLSYAANRAVAVKDAPSLLALADDYQAKLGMRSSGGKAFRSALNHLRALLDGGE